MALSSCRLWLNPAAWPDYGALRQMCKTAAEIPLTSPSTGRIFLDESIAVYTEIVYTILMLKNITLSADEVLIREARRQAALQNTTLNALFREWLEQYTGKDETAGKEAARRYDELMQRLSHVNAGRKFTREEMNERR